ncbi:MAG: PqqD family protein [Erythrobacter sp.]|jgi:hypothetical protein|nr:PqqD family protein [Erythrobacter sp.]
MSDLLQARWEPSPDAMANAVGGETVILHLGNGTYYGLDQISSRLWNGLKGGLRPSDICAELLDEYDVERQQLESDISELLRDLAEHDLITRA